MRRVPIVLMTLLLFTTVASAQTSVRPADPTRMTVFGFSEVTKMSPDIVVARMMSFDADRDGRVAKGELPERMHDLFLSDRDGDGTLDGDEIRAMTTRPSAVTAGGFPRSGGYTFGDQISLSSRAHVEGALNDLRLPSSSRDQARAIVTTFMDALEAEAAETLVKELTPMLTTGQLNNFKATLDLQLSRKVVPDAPLPPPFNKTVRVLGGLDLSSRIHGFGLAPEQTAQALAAVERFKATIRPGDEARSALLDQVKDVLSDEERDNFRAALERRPLVKSGMPGMVTFKKGDVPGGVVNGVVGDALFRMPSPPQPRVLVP